MEKTFTIEHVSWLKLLLLSKSPFKQFLSAPFTLSMRVPKAQSVKIEFFAFRQDFNYYIHMGFCDRPEVFIVLRTPGFSQATCLNQL